MLKKQQDEAWELRNMLTKDQERNAVLTSGKLARIPRGMLPPIKQVEGLPASDMTKEQQAVLRSIFESFAETLHPTLFYLEMSRYDAIDPSAIHFLWHNNGNPERRYYYRIHAPEILIEFNLLDGNHIHALWRNPKQDFGKDLLRDHLKNEHQ